MISAPYRCMFDHCTKDLASGEDVLDHIEAFPSHASSILILRPQPGDHVYINQLESSLTPWLTQHHGIAVPGSISDTIKICSFVKCNSSSSTIGCESAFAFSRGNQLFLFPQRCDRPDATSFALACVGKVGYDSKTFNCEHFTNLCITGKASSTMSSNGLIIFGGIAGTLATVIGGAVGTGLWLAGKAALVGKMVADNMTEKSPDHSMECQNCNIPGEYLNVHPRCKHVVCTSCLKDRGNNLVCPIEDCYERFSQLSKENTNYS
jgi:hypothetical protein